MSKEREVEICNVEGSLKGWGGKKKRWSLHQIETWAEREREFEICNVEGSLKGGVEKNVEAFRYCMRKQRVWKLSTFLLYRFLVTAAYLISFLPLFLSTRFINTDRTSLLWSLHLNSFFLVQNFYALFILIWDPFFLFVCVCVCVYIRRASLAFHWCVCEIAWMSFQ